MEEYRVKLNEFEGPMELLLELIEKEKMNISDISLASVCDQFLEYTKHFEEEEPNYLANFLVIASRLILIKSKSLLPFLELTEEEEEDIDELKQRLEEFQKIKEGAKLIKELEGKMQISYERSSDLKNVKVFKPPKEISKDSLFNIFVSIKEVLEKEVKPLEEKKMEVIVSFEEKLKDIKERLQKGAEEYFHKITNKEEKANTIVAFLAVLELIKQRFLTADQEGNFSSIKIKRI